MKSTVRIGVVLSSGGVGVGMIVIDMQLPGESRVSTMILKLFLWQGDKSNAG